MVHEELRRPMHRVALVGCGRISDRHIIALAAHQERCRLTGVCDLESSGVEKAQRRYQELSGHEAQGFVSFEAMLQQLSFDILTIATESGFHYEHAKAGLMAGKHVLIEKPMTLSVSEAVELIALADEKGLKLGVCHQNRFNPPIQALRRAVDLGGFGRLVNGTARILWNRNMGYYQQAPWRGTWAQDGGTLMNQCIHNIDLLQWMMGGEPETVYCQAGTFLRDIEGEDFGAITIRFRNGAIGLVEGSACVYPKNLEETLSIFGEKGTAVIGGLAVNKLEQWLFEDTAVTALGEVTGTEVDSVYGEGHTPLYADFFDAVLNDRAPLIDGCEGLKALSVILAAYKSRKTGLPVRLDESFSFSTLEMAQ